MLYVSTRNNTDAYTAQRVLRDLRCSEGGLFVPFRLPRLTREEILSLGEKSFNQCAAEMLNLLFNTHLTGYDLDFALGRYWTRMEQLGRKVIAAECWHNADRRFDRMVRDLTDLIRVQSPLAVGEGDWACVGVRMAVLFGLFGELIRSGIASIENVVDVAVCGGDFSAPMSAWYARGMGLPIGNIVCCCNENGNLWNFICHGQLRTDAVAVSTPVPEADVAVSVGLERLIFAAGGYREVARYVDALRRGATYYVEDALLRQLRKGIYVTVSSTERILQTIPNAYATHEYVFGPGGAMVYAGLQDYRARTGESRTALILMENSPALDGELTARALGITQKELEAKL